MKAVQRKLTGATDKQRATMVVSLLVAFFFLTVLFTASAFSRASDSPPAPRYREVSGSAGTPSTDWTRTGPKPARAATSGGDPVAWATLSAGGGDERGTRRAK